MAEFEVGLLVDDSRYRFLRLDEQIYLSEPFSWKRNTPARPNHLNLANEHGIAEEIRRRRSRLPDSVDGGFFTFLSNRLLISERSNEFAIPVFDTKARQITAASLIKRESGLMVFTRGEDFLDSLDHSRT